jgi:hypothetical protein
MLVQPKTRRNIIIILRKKGDRRFILATDEMQVQQKPVK